MDFLIFVIDFVFSAYYIILAVRALLPWVDQNKSNPLARPVYFMTDWLLAPVRAALPPQKIGLDVSPFIMIFLLWLLQRLILMFLT